MILVDNSLVGRKDFGVDVEDRAYQFGDFTPTRKTTLYWPG